LNNWRLSPAGAGIGVLIGIGIGAGIGIHSSSPDSNLLLLLLLLADAAKRKVPIAGLPAKRAGWLGWLPVALSADDRQVRKAMPTPTRR
jgi:hypothetical protein